MPGMSEMRECVSMEGSWQVRVKIGGRMICEFPRGTSTVRFPFTRLIAQGLPFLTWIA